MHYPKDLHAIILYAVHDHIFTDGQAAVSGAEITFTRTSQVRKARQREKTASDGIDETIGRLETAAFRRDVIPDVIEIGCGARGKSVLH